MECVRCGSTDFKKNGTHKGVQRYQCSACKRFFSDRVRKFSYRDKCRALDFYLNNTGIRKTARFMGCSSAMVVRWIREAARNLKRQNHFAAVLGEQCPLTGSTAGVSIPAIDRVPFFYLTRYVQIHLFFEDR